MRMMVVLFPHPEFPTRAVFCPGISTKEKFFKISTSGLFG